MGGTKRKRTAWATGLSLALHVLMLAGMVVGLKVAKPPPEGRAIELTLVQPLQRAPAPAQPAPPHVRAAAPPPLRPHLAPAQPAVPPPGVALPEVKGPPPAEPRSYGPVLSDGGVKPSLSGRLGCDEDPLRRKELSEQQKQVCANNLVARAKAAPQLPLNIAPDKLAEYSRNSACRQKYTKQAIPRLTDQTDTSVANNLPTVMPSGLGSVPAPKDCGFGER